MSKVRTHHNLHKRSTRGSNPRRRNYCATLYPLVSSPEVINGEIAPQLIPTETVTEEIPQEKNTPQQEEQLWTSYPEWASDETIDYVNSILGIYEPWESKRINGKNIAYPISSTESSIIDDATLFADRVIQSIRDAKANNTFNYDQVKANDPDYASEESIAIVNSIMGYPSPVTKSPSQAVVNTISRPILSISQETEMLRRQSESWEFVYKRRRFNSLRKAGKKIVAFAVAATTLFGAYSFSNKNTSHSQSITQTTETIIDTGNTEDTTNDKTVTITNPVTAPDLILDNQEPPLKLPKIVHQKSLLLSINEKDTLTTPEIIKDYTVLPWKFGNDILQLKGEELIYGLTKTLQTFNDMYSEDFQDINGQYINSSGFIMNQDQVEDFNFIFDTLSR